MKITKQTAYYLKLTEDEALHISRALHVAQLAVNGKWTIGTDVRYQGSVKEWQRIESQIDDEVEKQ